MNKWFGLAAMAAALAGCATTAGYEKMLNTYVNQPEDALIGRWGPPDSVYQSGSKKYLTFMKTAEGYVPGTPPMYQTNFVGNTAYTSAVGGSPGYSYSMRCKTTFLIENKKVQSWRWEGNSCRAPE